MLSKRSLLPAVCIIYFSSAHLPVNDEPSDPHFPATTRDASDLRIAVRSPTNIESSKKVFHLFSYTSSFLIGTASQDNILLEV